MFQHWKMTNYGQRNLNTSFERSLSKLHWINGTKIIEICSTTHLVNFFKFSPNSVHSHHSNNYYTAHLHQHSLRITTPQSLRVGDVTWWGNDLWTSAVLCQWLYALFWSPWRWADSECWWCQLRHNHITVSIVAINMHFLDKVICVGRFDL